MNPGTELGHHDTPPSEGGTAPASQRRGWQSAIERTVSGLGYELIDIERPTGGLLRVTIDRVPGRAYPTGESESLIVDDCEAVTRQLQYVLEVESCAYSRLEVSSPGLDRPLKRAADYARFAGEQVVITLKEPFQGRKRWQGTLLAKGESWQLLLAGETAAAGRPAPKGGKRPAKSEPSPAAPDTQQVLEFDLHEVREARLVPVVDFKGRKGHPEQGARSGQNADTAAVESEKQSAVGGRKE